MTETKQAYLVQAPQTMQPAGQPFTQGQIDLIKRTIAKDASNDELTLFLYQCERTGLDPFSRQIHFVSRWSERDNRKVGVIQIGIDGFRAVADRTGAYAGNDDPVFAYGEDKRYPDSATVTVWKIVGGQRCPFTATARWDEYYPGKKNGFMWDKLPHLMLSKCAEALACRKAFPLQLSGLYAPEEMEQVGQIVEATPNTQPVAVAEDESEPRPHWIDKPKAAAALWIWTRDELALKDEQVYRLMGIRHIHDFHGSMKEFKTELLAAVTKVSATPDEQVAEIVKEAA